MLLAFLFMLSFSLNLSAQNKAPEKETKKHSYQIGTNIGLLFKKLIHPKKANLEFAPTYVLLFKSKKTDKDVAFRLAIGGDYTKTIVKANSPTNPTDEDIENFQKSFLLRLGLEKQKSVSKRWQYYYGVDVSFYANNQKGSGLFGLPDAPTTKTRTFSLDPLLGIQFRLTPHLVLQTEAVLTFYYNTTSDIPVFLIDPFPLPMPVEMPKKDFSLYGANLVAPNILNLILEF